MMIRKNARSRILFGVTFVLVVILSIVALQLLINNCFWWECAPKRSFSALDLNLPDSFFPNETEIHALHYVRSDTSNDPAISTNFWSGGTSIYRVQKSATERQAIKEYDFNVKTNPFTKPLDDNSIIKYSDVLNFQSKVADANDIQCGYVIDDIRCNYIARYKEFTISFMSSVGSDGMTRDNYLDIIRYIDNRMNSLMKSSNQ